MGLPPRRQGSSEAKNKNRREYLNDLESLKIPHSGLRPTGHLQPYLKMPLCGPLSLQTKFDRPKAEEEPREEEHEDTQDYLAWKGWEEESQEWAQACSGLRQAVHTASPDFLVSLACPPLSPQVPGLAHQSTSPQPQPGGRESQGDKGGTMKTT